MYGAFEVFEMKDNKRGVKQSNLCRGEDVEH